MLIKLHGPWRIRRQLEIAIMEWIDWLRPPPSPLRDRRRPTSSTRPTGTVNKTSPSRQQSHNPHCIKAGALHDVGVAVRWRTISLPSTSNRVLQGRW